MDDLSAVTLARTIYLAAGVSADDYASAVLDLYASLGQDVLAEPDVQKGTGLRTRAAIRDTPLAFAVISRILKAITTNEVDRENLVFLLAKAIDDSLNLGAFYMAGRPREDLPKQITAADMARKGGQAKRAPVEKWRKKALPIVQAIRSEDTKVIDSDLIRELINRYGATKPVLPGSRQLQNWISSLVQAGQLVPSEKAVQTAKVRS